MAMVKKLDHWRQEGIFNPRDKEKQQVNIIGVGGIGSPTAMCLSKMGMDKITVYDDDTVELHNLPNQFYRFSDIGKSKVGGIADIVEDFSGVEVNQQFKQVKKEEEDGQATDLFGLTICGVDSLDIRRDLWEVVKFNMNIPLYIDARMGGEVCRIFTVNPCDTKQVEEYEYSIAPHIVPTALPCTERSIIYNTFMIASLISNQVKKYIMGEPLCKEIAFDMKTLSVFKI